MADNVLRVAAEFDVAPIIAGTQKAVASFNELGSAVQQQAARFAESGLAGQDLVSALTNLGYTAKDSAEAVAALGVAAATTDPQIAALQTQVNQLTGSLERATLASKESSSGIGGFRGAMGEARVEAGALTGSTGMMVGGLARIAAQSSTLAPIISELFPLFGAVAFIAILGDVISEFGKASDAFMGYTDEVKKAEKADIAFADKALEGARNLADADSKLANINAELARVEGEAFSEKYANAARDHQHAVLDFLGPLGNLVNVYLALAHAEGDAADQAARLTTGERAQMINTDEQRAELDKRAIALIKEKAAASEAAMTSDIDKTRAQIAALDEEETKQRQLAALEEGIAATKAGNINPDLAGVDANVVADYAAKRLELTNKLAQDEKRLNDEMAAANIESERKTGLAQLDARKQSIAQLRAAFQINADQEASLLNALEDDKLTIEKKYYDSEIALLKTQGVSKAAEIRTMQGDELKLTIDADAAKRANTAKAQEEDRKAYIAFAQGLQEEFLRLLEKGATQAAEEARKAAEAAKKAVEDTLSIDTETISTGSDRYAKEEEDNKRLYEHKLEFITTYEHRAMELAQEEYQFQLSIYTKELETVRAAVREKVLTEEEGSKKIQQIYLEEGKAAQQMEEKEKQARDVATVAMQKYFTELNTELNKAIVQWANGQKTFAQAAKEVWTSLVDYAIQEMLRMVEQWIETHIIMKAISLLFGQDDGSAAAAQKKIALNEAQIQSDAGVASADVFLQAIESIPFPGNLVAAPVLAQTAYTEAIAAAHFDLGGVVPGGSGVAVPAIVHGGERVLTPQQNVNFEKVARGGRSGDIHVHINHNGSNMTQADMVRAVKVGIRKGQLGNRF